MTIDQLRYFVEAAKFQHIGKAAKSINISPSAISAAIGALEFELGVQLFDRQGKAIILTSHGKYLQQESKKMIEHISEIKQGIMGEEHELSGQYRLGASHFLASRILSFSWSDLQNSHPGLVGEISSLPSVNVISDVVSGALDLGLCFGPQKRPDLIQETVYSGQLVIVVRAAHPIFKSKNDPRNIIKELSEYPAVLHKSHPGVDICEHHPVFDQHQLTPRISLLFDNDECAINKVITSDAWALVPDIILKHAKNEVKMVKLPKSWNAPYEVATIIRKDRAKNVALQKTHELIFKRLNTPK